MTLRNTRITSIACSGYHNCCVSSSGVVYSWGEGLYGQLGLGIETNRCNKPTIIPNLYGKDIVSVFCGHNHSMFLSSSGKVFACGNGYYGQLGLSLGIDYVWFILMF